MLISTNLILHIGTFDKDFNLSNDYNIGVQIPNKYNFNTWEDFVNFLENEVDIKKTQGIIVQDPNTNSNIKILNKKYYELSFIRNNVQSIKFRYLQIRNDEEMKIKIKELYPKHIKFFEEYENILLKISNKLYQCYINRFIKKIYTTVSPEENIILKKCHSWHNEDKEKNKISKEKVMEVINKLDSIVLNRLIKINKN